MKAHAELGSDFRRDQNGVVWSDRGFMSAKAYRSIEREGWPKYEDLPLWDSHDQNIVDVDAEDEV